MAVDYFTKWVEAEALANIRDVDVKRFVWRNIAMRFRVLKSLMSDNGLQFDSRAFREFCSSLGITNQYLTLTYPQSNGQAKATNKAIVSGLKKRLEGAKGKSAEELPNVLWTYQTTPRRIQPHQEFGINAETIELIGGTPGIGDYTVGRILAKTCPEIQQGREEKRVWSGRSGTLEGSGKYTRCQRKEASIDLGGIL
ncbi:uncharacterized protein K02A2.6-like [Quercus lobata]|uniref:uncharacterized protein K02A2.6-like n=1 Tax=Quercus lobata TaxID=97700 RepID=UPI001247C0B9|nr:uncharacterized protein K02A2.6-like [Quercus lobata]